MNRQGYYFKDKRIFLYPRKKEDNKNIRIYFNNHSWINGSIYDNENCIYSQIPHIGYPSDKNYIKKLLYYVPNEDFMKELVNKINNESNKLPNKLPNKFNGCSMQCIEIDCIVKSDIMEKGRLYTIIYYCYELRDILPKYQILDEDRTIIYPKIV